MSLKAPKAATSPPRLRMSDAVSLLYSRLFLTFLLAAGATQAAHAMFYTFGTLHWAMIFVLIATLGYALYNLATRYLAAFDPPAVTQTYSPLAGVVLMAPFAYLAWEWPQDAAIWVLLASLGFWAGSDIGS